MLSTTASVEVLPEHVIRMENRTTMSRLHHPSRTRWADVLEQVQDACAAGITTEIEGLLLHVSWEVQ